MFYGAVIIIGTLVVVSVGLILPRDWVRGVWEIGLQGVAMIAAGIAVSAVMVRKGWSSWVRLGWSGKRNSVFDFGFGLGLGVVMGVAALTIAVAAGGARIVLTGESATAYLGGALPYVVALTLAALGEELWFRGYPLARLARATGRPGASLLLAFGFAALHLPNPDVSALGLINIGLASLVLSALFFTPGGLPAAWGMHFGWNASLGIVADAPVSGVRFRLPALDYLAGDRPLITGGAFGPEGGVAMTIVTLVALVWLWRHVAIPEEGNL